MTPSVNRSWGGHSPSTHFGDQGFPRMPSSYAKPPVWAKGTFRTPGGDSGRPAGPGAGTQLELGLSQTELTLLAVRGDVCHISLSCSQFLWTELWWSLCTEDVSQLPVICRGALGNWNAVALPAASVPSSIALRELGTSQASWRHSVMSLPPLNRLWLCMTDQGRKRASRLRS